MRRGWTVMEIGLALLGASLAEWGAERERAAPAALGFNDVTARLRSQP